MSQNITFNGNGYVIPDLGEINWGQNLTDFFVSVPAGALQPTGGGFTLTAEVDFGGAFGLKSIYFKSRTTNPAAAGVVRLANTDTISFRNAANSADLTLGVNGSNQLTFNGVVLESDTLPSGDMFVGNASNSSTARTISGAWTMSNLGVATLSPDYIVNSMINSAAAIAYSKLNLSGSIVNADVNASAAIAYSKLNLAGSIVNADVNASAAIAYSKLNLSGSIVNADVNASAAIAYSKLAAITANRMLVSNSSGVLVGSSWVFDASDNLTTGANDEIRFQDSAGGDYVAFRAPASVTTHTYDLPIAAGTAGQVLSWQTGGQLQWINAAGGGTINSGLAGFFTYYPANGTTVDDQALLSTDGTNITLASGQYISPLGTAALPTYSFTGDTNTGIYSGSADRINISLGGTNKLTFDGSGFFNLIGSDLYIEATKKLFLDGGGDTYIIESSANQIDVFTNGSQRFAIAASGLITSLGKHEFTDGSAAAPALSFSGDPDTGLYRITSGLMGFSSNTTLSLQIDSSSTYFRDGSANTPGMCFINDDNTGIYRVSTDVLGFSTAGTFRGAFNSLGYFGVGALPSFALHVQRSVSDTTNRMVISNTNGTSGQERRSFVTAIGDNLTNEISLVAGKDSSNTAYEMLGGTTFIQFGTGGTERARMTSAGAFNVGDGTSSLPSLSFLSDTDLGFYRIGANQMGVSVGTNLVFRFGFSSGSGLQVLFRGGTSASEPGFALAEASGVGFYRVTGLDVMGVSAPMGFQSGSAANPSITWAGDENTGLYKDAADRMQVSCGGSEVFRFGTTQISTNNPIVASKFLAGDGTSSAPTLSFDSVNTIGLFRPSASSLGLAIPTNGNFFFYVNSVEVLRYDSVAATFYSDGLATKTVDVGTSAKAFDDMYADDFNNVADIPFFDYVMDGGRVVSVNDLEVIKNIKPLRDANGNLRFNENGHAYWDDDTLPNWVWHRNKHTGQITRDADGKPWISMKVLAGLALGATGQIIRELDGTIIRLNTVEQEIKQLKERLAVLEAVA